jgi:S-adenosylmethionine:tRNA ribosyltransferase-isomerase
VDVRDFDFELPSRLIAQDPPVERTAARLLFLAKSTNAITHAYVRELPGLLVPGDLLVVNNTRVFAARLLGRRVPSGGAVECLLIGLHDPNGPAPRKDVAEWDALMHPGQKLKPGARFVFEGGSRLHGEIVARQFFGRRTIRLWTDDGSDIDAAIDAIGHVPLPPYVKRADRAADRDRYQTIFARARGSVAAPTAGLHFTPALVAALQQRGIEFAEITLHVGYGTFQPVRVERVEDHHLETERYEIDAEAAQRIENARRAARRVIAVGTTTTRTLEAVAAAHDGTIVPAQGASDLFIYPGFEFRVVGGLLTNFHLPRSSLLMLVAALAGRERVLGAYAEAIAVGYRFYSYGDAMLIL